MPRPAIIATGIGVKYDLRLNRERTLRRTLAALVKAAPTDNEEFWAIRDVSLVVRSGETLGVIGSNGAGKSTLLLALAGVIGPDEGSVQTYGKRPTLLTLGAGFESELTGRDNIRLNGAYLGLSRKQIDALIEPIIDFSELGEFIDVPLKKYSTGMRARLGFAIAATTDPDILLLDEVLSVGDPAFQAKSRHRMLHLIGNARAIVVVSHDLTFIESACSQAVWLERGRMQAVGEVGLVVEAYRDQVAETVAASYEAEGQ